MPATERNFYDLKSLHVVFAASSLALLGTTFWMLGADHDREWHGVQGTFHRIEALRNREDLHDLETPAYREEVAGLEQRIAAAQQAVAGHEQQYSEAHAKTAEAKRELTIADSFAKERRAFRDAARANHGLGVRDQVPAPELNRLLLAYEAEEQKVAAAERDLEAKQNAFAQALAAEQQITGTRDKLQAELKTARTAVELKRKALERLEPESALAAAKRKIMTWPIVDGFNSPRRIQMDWLPNLKIKLGMAETARFDRCRTCHLGIDRSADDGGPAFPFGDAHGTDPHEWVKTGKYPQPFASHPRLDLYATASSPHPVETFGCTICHEGQGSGTSFSNASHGPGTPLQEHEWERHHHFHSNHYWEYPMLPKRFAEASCLKCHHQVEELAHHPKFGPTAPKLYKGYSLVRRFGCFGCHEINGWGTDRTLGPDLRLEPEFASVAKQILADPVFSAKATGQDEAAAKLLDAARTLARDVQSRPEETGPDRNQLRDLLAKDAKSKTPVFAKATHALGDGLKDVDHPGWLRKVGPSLRHVAAKTTPEWLADWTEEPKRFRPDTRMPQFFKLANQQDDAAHRLQPVEIAGVVQYLMDKSQPLDLVRPKAGYQPDAARGAETFARRGCLACHTHGDKYKGSKADFGPDLSRVHEKIKPGGDGFAWLYSWLKDPQKHHPRSRMPNLYLEPETVAGAETDPAADIAAFLLSGGPKDYPAKAVDPAALDELVAVLLPLSESQEKAILADRRYPFPADQVRGDEIELASADPAKSVPEAEWTRRKLNYVGRRTISRYGCFGCHDVPGFETARPIGTALQDWGRKDTSRLAFEHIVEFLEHHGEPDGSSTMDRVKKLEKRAVAGEFPTREEQDRVLAPAYYVDSIEHHGRAGFLWQKLREPRSYDYETTDTKRYDERLRMPKFPVGEDDIEAIATFVLGLVAEPPAEQYVYAPQGASEARIVGERLLQKYNCTGCHMVELPEIAFGANPAKLPLFKSLHPDSYPEGFELLLRLKPPRNAETGRKLPTGEKVIAFRGLEVLPPDREEAPEDQFYYFNTWENLRLSEGLVTMDSPRLEVPVARLESIKPARGGEFAQWLVDHLVGGAPTVEKRDKAWQAAPPPLHQEGLKVQTPWLYRFLRDPGKIRYTTALRMPRFNMSADEAQTLANYFAAVDGEPFPYQRIPEREPDYLAAREALLEKEFHAHGHLQQGWKVMTAPAPAGVCIKCHAVGGMEYKGTGQKDEVRGPNLMNVPDRLRPDWTMLWLYKPSWITPYTAMPQPLPRSKKQFEQIYGGDGNLQSIAVRDALMNYSRLIESESRGTAGAPAPAVGGGAAAGTGGD